MPNNEFGDFQTPPALAEQIVRLLGTARRYGRILDPTCGTGGFLRAAGAIPGTPELLGVEVQPQHVARASAVATVVHGNVFDLDLGRDLPWTGSGPMLVVGNPPWVTSADLSRFGSANIPAKSNVNRLGGMDARTGSSNFDVAEYIWLKLIRELRTAEPTIALLCKTQVARNVIARCAADRLPIRGASLYLVDSMRWFGAAVDAGLLVLDVGAGSYVCDVYQTLQSEQPSTAFGMVGGKLVADLAGYVHTRSADGSCPYEWRQGIKHDATHVMELVEDGGPRRKSGERVDVEGAYLYPLFKGTDVFRDRTASVSRWMVVPQRGLAEGTATLESTAPRLWSYLSTHAAALDGRKSSVYARRPRFSIFGVGDYSFLPFKVAISGMHKEPRFRLVGPVGGRPAVFDDTCYFLSFADAAEAAIACAVLQSGTATTLLGSLVFGDSKRPVTKRLLRRLDLARIAALEDPVDLAARALQLCEHAGIIPRPAAGEVTDRLAALVRQPGTRPSSSRL